MIRIFGDNNKRQTGVAAKWWHIRQACFNLLAVLIPPVLPVFSRQKC